MTWVVPSSEGMRAMTCVVPSSERMRAMTYLALALALPWLFADAPNPLSALTVTAATTT
jgi:hypothetical protein